MKEFVRIKLKVLSYNDRKTELTVIFDRTLNIYKDQN